MNAFFPISFVLQPALIVLCPQEGTNCAIAITDSQLCTYFHSYG